MALHLHLRRACPPHDGEEDPILNTATVSGQDLDGDPVTGDTHDTSVNVIHDAGTLTITKSADVAAVGHGGTITYTLRQLRPGRRRLAGPDHRGQRRPSARRGVRAYQDHRGRSRQRRDTTSTDGETWTYTCTYTVPAGHSDGEEDPITNTASVSGTDLDGDPVTVHSNNESVNVIHDAGTLDHHQGRRRRLGRPTAAPSPTPSTSTTPRDRRLAAADGRS